MVIFYNDNNTNNSLTLSHFLFFFKTGKKQTDQIT